MNPSLLGLTVTRAIPPDVLVGLLTNQYKLYGGVIRWAPGTEYAGQIVRHLVPVTSNLASSSFLGPVSGVLEAVNTYQLHKLNIATQQVLQIATGTMTLAGLNLVVSAVGFAVINQKLKNLEGQLNVIQQEVRAIRELLELDERAKLGAALQNLLYAMQSQNMENRRHMLFDAKNVLAPINLKYKELWAKADTIETAMGYEEYFSLTSLANTRCLAELGMLEIARRHLDDDYRFWQEQSRRITHDHLLGPNPERFLFSDFADDVPSAQVITWLDFAEDSERGYDWIDELRSKMNPWYAPNRYSDMGRSTTQVFSSLSKVITRKTPEGMTVEKQKVIPALQKLTARNNVLQGYVAQYELMEKHNITPTEFEKQ
ncbi:MAG: hypothetical protein KDI62_21540, partial [Anaerolineae bacterium]|nr:hypothetical protein [Anaerolineae bacterium]